MHKSDRPLVVAGVGLLLLSGLLWYSAGNAHADPCDFSNGGSPAACAGSEGMQEMEDYEEDMSECGPDGLDGWGVPCGGTSSPADGGDGWDTSQPEMYEPELVPVSLTYNTSDGEKTIEL